MAEIRQVLKNGFRSLGRGQNEAFPIKILDFKIFILLFSKITIFAKFSKNHVLSFLLMSGLCAINSLLRRFDF